MKLVGTATGNLYLPTSPGQAFDFLNDPRQVLGGIPQCVRIARLHECGIYQWTFEIDDPMGNPFRVVSVVRQTTVHGATIVWRPFDLDWSRVDLGGNGFLGRTSGEMRVCAVERGLTRLDAALEFGIDFEIPVAMRHLPMRWIEWVSRRAMDRKMETFVGQILRRLETTLGGP